MSHKSHGESESLKKAPPDDESVGPPSKKQRSDGAQTLLDPISRTISVFGEWFAKLTTNPDRERAKLLAEAFVKSIMVDYENIPYSNGMSVLRNVIDLETAELRDVVIRSFTEEFWQACIDTANTPNMRYRVCAVGTPGIGKTTLTPILIRMLLKMGHTVVYLVRSKLKVGWYYEFAPSAIPTSSSSSSLNATNIHVCVYPEALEYTKIKSLKKKSTYYVVDPGRTEDDCDPYDWFQAKVIVVASPDEKHWGGSEFTKGRGNIGGFFKYFPLWSLKELLDARPILGPDLADEEIKQRYRQVGGVPRHVFRNNSNLKLALSKQQKAMNTMTKDAVLKIASGTMDAVETMDKKQPKSAIMGYKISDSDDGSFEQEEVVIISSLVAEKVYTEHIKNIWSKMFDPQVNGWKIFEAYTRALMANNGQRARFQCRSCVGRGIGNWRNPEYYKKHRFLYLGGCAKIRLVLNIVEAAKNSQNVLFHSVDKAYELIDFIYRDKKGKFHAFQVTLGASHTANPEKIKELQLAVGGPKKLVLYYLVPGEQFKSFVTKPVDQRKEGKGVSCDIWHVLIPDPNESDEGTKQN